MNTSLAEKKKKISAKLSENKHNQEYISGFMKEYFKEEEIKQALDKSAVNAIKEYIQELGPTLTDEQLDNLEKLFDSRYPQANAALSN